MVKCQICQKKIKIPFKCSYCGGVFCVKHRLPENHSCTGLPERTFLADKGQKAYRREASYSEGKNPEVTRSRKRQYSPILVIFLVLSIGLNGFLYLNYDQSKQEIESLNEKYSLLDENHKTLTQEFADFKTDSRRKIVEAYDTGYGEGNVSGYSLGLIVGEERGFSQGNETGTEIGYRKGFDEGLEVGARGDYEGWGCFVRDPTYAEVLKFISEDKTDKMEYIEGEFVCHEFAYTFKNNAYQKGYRCFYVHIGLLDGGHAIVGFNSTDRGMMYIEPQNDYFVELEVGKHYWTECVILPPGHYYKSPSYDDTIIHFKVYW